MSLLGDVKRWFEYPHRFVATREQLGRPNAVVLDVGCGNHSPSLTKRFFPSCVYHGVDNSRWNRDAADDRAIDRFIDLDLDSSPGLPELPDDTYDVVLCSHVLEHLEHPYACAQALAAKLRVGGVLYAEFPSPRSLRLPRAKDGWMLIRGCLNFYDDPTHSTMIDAETLVDVLRQSGCSVSPPRRRFLWRRVALLPAYVAAGLVLRRYVPASVMWDVTGFALCVTARRDAAPGEPVTPTVVSTSAS